MVRKPALAVVLTRRVGFWNASRILAFIVAWGVMSEDLGRPPESIEEYADYWKTSHRSAYREQALFRKGLPDDATPTRIWELAREQLRDRDDDDVAAAQLGTLNLAI
jgi:hypothetical protein